MKTLRTLALAAACLYFPAAHAGLYDDLMNAAYRDDTQTVAALIDRGMDVNSVDPAGNTLLHIAARNGNVQLLEFLLKNRANPLVRNRVGDTALMLAAYNDKQEAAKFLIAKGADVNNSGWTPLHYAVFAEKPEMVHLLLDKGAKPDLKAPNEQTALMLAAKVGNVALIDMLLKAGAKPELKDQHGETALDIAKKQGNPDAIRLLETAMKDAAKRIAEEEAAAKAAEAAAAQAEPAAVAEAPQKE